MFVLGNLFLALAKILGIVLNLYMWVLVARAVVSWIHLDPTNPVIQLLSALTEPVLRRIRRALRLPHSPVDVSPLLAILFVWFLNRFLVPTLARLGHELGGKI